KGRFVLLSSWPGWMLAVFIALVTATLAVLTYRKISTAAPRLKTWRIWVLWAVQSGFVALVLLLFWQPAIVGSALCSQQSIIAVVVDESRSMAMADSDGRTRETAALNILEGGLLSQIQKRFQVRLYRLGGSVTRIDGLKDLQPQDSATNI